MMSFWRASCVAALMLASTLGSQAIAQNAAQDPRGGERSPRCLPRATRLREHCDPVKVVVRAEATTAVTRDSLGQRPRSRSENAEIR